MRKSGRLAGAVAAVGIAFGIAEHAKAVVLYDSGGFESSAGYVAGLDLTGQVAGSGANAWQQSGSTVANAPYPYAEVIHYASSPLQLVGVADVNIGSTDYGAWYPATNIASPFTPAGAQNHVLVSWTETYTAGTGDPFFGIQVYNGATNIALMGVDTTNNLLVVQNPSATDELGSTFFNGSAGVAYQFQMDLNYTTQQYGVYVNGALVDTEPFVAPATQFTDADILTYALGNSTANGYGYFDNYVVTAQSAIPEPGSLSLVLTLVPALLGRRRGRGPVLLDQRKPSNLVV